jgi:hypothetical protein
MIVVFFFLIIISLISSCSKKEESPSANNNQAIVTVNNTPQDKIIGLWEGVENGQTKRYEFLMQGVFIDYYGGGLYNYKFASDKTIAIMYEKTEQIYKLLRLVNVSNNAMVFEEDGIETKYKRVTPPKNLRENIIGVWESDNGSISEYTSSGIYLYLPDNPSYYQILSDYTIAYYEDSQKQDLMGLDRCVEATDNLITLGFHGEGPDLKLKKLPGYKNLVTDIIGAWKFADDGENAKTVIEFADNASYILYDGPDGPEIKTYKIISNNTILMDGEYVYIQKISKKELQMSLWSQMGEEGLNEIVTLIK